MATEKKESTFEETLTRILTHVKNGYEKDMLKGIRRLLKKKQITSEEYLMQKMRVDFINLYIDKILELISNQDDCGVYEVPCMECMMKIRMKNFDKPKDKEEEKIEPHDIEETYEEE